jgi:hypothetical protein
VYDHTHARHFFSQALLSGPISVVFEVYNDFLEYSSGVYIPNKGSGLVGYIQMRLIGYGATSGASPLKYWIGALVRARACFLFSITRGSLASSQTWGASFGEGGYIRIVRGQDACGIENGVLGYCPAQLVAA